MARAKLHLLLALTFCSIALAAVAGCQWNDRAEMYGQAMEDRPASESWNVVFNVSENGVRRIAVEADHYATHEAQDSVYTALEGGPAERDHQVRALIYDDDGDLSATLTSDKLLYYENEGRFEARGKVVVISEQSKRLESEHLTWNESEKRIRTPGFVRIETPTERIQGYSLVADEDLTTYSLARVTGQVTIEDEE